MVEIIKTDPIPDNERIGCNKPNRGFVNTGECVYCGREKLFHFNSRIKICGKCYTACEICGAPVRIKKEIKGVVTCSRKCSTTYASRKSIESKIIKWCDKCEKDTLHYSGGKCITCINSTPERKEIARKNINKYNYSENAWNKSDACREHAKKVMKKIHENYIGTQKHRENARRTIIKYNKSKEHRDVASRTINEFNNSERGKEILKQNGERLKEVNKEIWSKMTPGEKEDRLRPMREGNKEFWENITEEKLQMYKCMIDEAREIGIREDTVGYRVQYCQKCGRKTLHAGADNCSVCNSWQIFDRDRFYSQKIEAARVLSKEIPLDFIDCYNGVPGVWSIETASGICLEVCETIDIGTEMRLGVRKLAKGRENLSLTEDEIRDKYTRPGEYLKYRSIVARSQELGSEIVFKIIETNVQDIQDRHTIEAIYAHQNRAEFWSPSPLQNIKRLLSNRNL